MASLNKLAIRGIRSFDDKQISVIQFFSPVTVIVGHNGSGKTTIIECLKYATTGDQPPNTRGGAFVHDPKMANEKEVKAQVKLSFHAANGVDMLAVRSLSVTVKKTAGLTMKTLEGLLAVADGSRGDGKRKAISTKCAEMDTEIPQLLGVSKSVLENVIFCHQEDSYWPLAEPAALKKKFDDIFEATRYTKALDSIKALRKDRVADLKAEKERLTSLAYQKAEADKLKGRISTANSDIAALEIEYEETKRKYQELVVANQLFFDRSTKFREKFIQYEGLQDNLSRFTTEQKNMDHMKIRKLPGTDAELQKQQDDFDAHMREQGSRRDKEEVKRQELLNAKERANQNHLDLVNLHGELVGESKAQERRITEREELIVEICGQHGIKGFNHSPLEREKIIEFTAKLDDLRKRQRDKFEKLQADIRAKNEEYNRKAQQLHTELEGCKLQKTSLREQIRERQASIASDEAELDKLQTVPSELKTLMGDIEEKTARLNKIKADMKVAEYDEKLSAKTTRSRNLEDKRDEMNAELRSLSLQADSRAKLDLKRAEAKSKNAERKNILEVANAKYRKIVGMNATADTIEREVDRVLSEKEQEHLEREGNVTSANNRLQQAETTLTNLKAQLKTKKDELKVLERKMSVLDREQYASLDEAIKVAMDEVSNRQQTPIVVERITSIFDSLLKTGERTKVCTVCNRGMNDNELIVFKRYLEDRIAKTSLAIVATNAQELAEWTAELEDFQGLLPVEASIKRLRSIEIPGLEQQIKAQEASILPITRQVEDATEQVDALKRELKDISILKQHAGNISRLHKELDTLDHDITNIESDLAATGSTKTADDVQAELDKISTEIRLNERERQTLLSEKERHNNSIRVFEGTLHSMQLRERDLTVKIRDKAILEERIEAMKTEISLHSRKLKDLDAKIAEAQAPIDQLDNDHKALQSELNSKVATAQQSFQDLNFNVDRFESTNKAITRYVREKKAQQLQEIAEKIQHVQGEIVEFEASIEATRESVARIDKLVNESGANIANIRDNLRYRKLMQDIARTQVAIDALDINEADKARRIFNAQYPNEKQREVDLQATYSHIGGQVSTKQALLTEMEEDLKKQEGIYKAYTDQLIRVKMSDMANSDLEKYAKALDNAIMKYHGLKMEEVNDTMRHLWNKTYQGTDIDGIKIASDVEGGASKRSYNYRVVMTKDQVEMDMRGRCSAGQKMLASIIIRLALSDSFGQNCGILALDEPTNALDTENIDALAASLVDIINERKNHSNFQLIIITHDENFLRKLGQSDVMEYYWRVSRDSRQKSVIERQRFR